jgi:TIR domain
MTKLQRATSKTDAEYHAWIFISHASDDLLRVREVRNYLESKGASPLLFHLKALANPEEFWPIIEREIAARNFFLYCQSAVADEREWVRRERAAVTAAGRERAIRVDSIRVDGGDIDLAKLDAFLAKTRVFPAFSREDSEAVRPFLLAMERAGFQVFLDMNIPSGASWLDIMHEELEAAARHGWVVLFVSKASVRSKWVQYEMETGKQLGAIHIRSSLR